MEQSFSSGIHIITFIEGDITSFQADAIVNAANSSLLGGGGVDGAIHAKGGPQILEACKKLREQTYPDGLPTGEAVSTTAGTLQAKYVIHTVGPIWRGGNQNEERDLARCYRNCLRVARELDCKTIIFPAISTGVYHFPKNQAARIAFTTVQAVLQQTANNLEVRFCLYGESDYKMMVDLFQQDFA
jgi:O-acetyl-ADP-ribose deacetylase